MPAKNDATVPWSPGDDLGDTDLLQTSRERSEGFQITNTILWRAADIQPNDHACPIEATRLSFGAGSWSFDYFVPTLCSALAACSSIITRTPTCTSV